MVRMSLRDYETRDVDITGIYIGPAPKHEDIDISKFDFNRNVPKNTRDSIVTFEKNLDDFEQNMVAILDKTSLIINVRGINDFGNIVENHIILYENLLEEYGIMVGGRVNLRGRVISYTKWKDNICYRDYGLTNIRHIKNIT